MWSGIVLAPVTGCVPPQASSLAQACPHPPQEHGVRRVMGGSLYSQPIHGELQWGARPSCEPLALDSFGHGSGDGGIMAYSCAARLRLAAVMTASWPRWRRAGPRPSTWRDSTQSTTCENPENSL